MLFRFIINFSFLFIFILLHRIAMCLAHTLFLLQFWYHSATHRKNKNLSELVQRKCTILFSKFYHTTTCNLSLSKFPSYRSWNIFGTQFFGCWKCQSPTGDGFPLPSQLGYQLKEKFCFGSNTSRSKDS